MTKRVWCKQGRTWGDCNHAECHGLTDSSAGGKGDVMASENATVDDRDELFFENETRKHQQAVGQLMTEFAMSVLCRAVSHDRSKLQAPEREIFMEATPKLAGLTYGSKEYGETLKEMQVALDHHYANNEHHPECHKDGIDSMSLIDVVEMYFDWLAAIQRHADGDFEKSMEHNQGRFGMSEQLSNIFYNTARSMLVIK